MSRLAYCISSHKTGESVNYLKLNIIKYRNIVKIDEVRVRGCHFAVNATDCILIVLLVTELIIALLPGVVKSQEGNQYGAGNPPRRSRAPRRFV